MTYAELLQCYIEQSGKTLEQIAEECSRRGVKIHPTYISKLRLGKRPSASEEITRMLAEVTGGDPQQLIIQGYIDKRPKGAMTELLATATTINIEHLREIVKQGLLTDTRGDALPDYLVRPLLAHIEGIIEILKKKGE